MATQIPELDLLGQAMTTDDPVQLLAQIKDVLAKEPNDAIALAAQGAALQRGGDHSTPDEILSSLVKASEEACGDFLIWPRVAGAVHSLGLSDAFLDELKKRANDKGSTELQWLVLGKFQFYLNQNDSAVASLKEATARDESSDLAWLELARASVDAQQADLALDAIAQVIRIDPTNESIPIVPALRIAALCLRGQQLEALDAWRAQPLPFAFADVQRAGIQLAESLLMSKLTKEAIEIIDQIESKIASPTGRSTALRIKTQALIVEANYEEALKVLETAGSLDVENQERARLRFWEAITLERLGRVNEALARTDDALSLEPSEGDAPVIHLIRARMLNNSGQFQRSLDELTNLRPELLPEDLRGEFSLHQGVALVGLGQSKPGLERLDEALSQNQNAALLPSIFYWRGRGLIAQKQFEKALDALDQANRSGFPESERFLLYFVESLALSGLGRSDEAIEKIDRALALPSNNKFIADLFISKARILGSQKKTEAALATLDSAFAVSPDKTEQGLIELERATIAEAAGPEKTLDALKYADAALAAFGDEDDTKEPRSRALGIRARALKIQGNNEGALDALDRLATIEPGVNHDLGFINTRWEILLLLKRHADALDLIRNIVNGQSPIAGNPLLKIMIGETLRREGNTEGYFAALAAAVEVPPEHAGNPTAWFAVLTAAVGTRRFKEATDAIEHLKVLDAALFSSPPVRVLRAQTLAGLNEFQSALELVQDASGLEGPWKIMSLQVRAQAFSETGDPDQAVTALDELIAAAAAAPETDPAITIFAMCMKANFLVRLNKNAEARDTVSAMRKLPGSPSMSELIDFVAGTTEAVVLNRLGQNAEALTAINTAIDAEAKARVMLPAGFVEPGRTLWIKGVILFESHLEELALAAFEQAQLAGLQGSEGLIWQGLALLALEDPDRALPVFEAAVREAASRKDISQQFDALLGKGRALHDADIYDAAVAVYREALRVAGKMAESSVQFWRRLGESYYALGRYGPALGAYYRGWAIKQTADVARGISAVRIRQKLYREAQRFIDKDAAQFAAKDSALTYNRALALWGQGDFKEAKRIINEASESGVVEATEFASALKPKRDGAGGWWEMWFGNEAGRTRRVVGGCLLVSMASALAAPVFAYSQNTLDWKVALVPAVVALVLLLIPSIKGLSLSTDGVKLDVEPSLLGQGGDAPKPDLLPLGSFYIITASLQSISNPTDVRQTELDDPNLRLIARNPQISAMTGKVGPTL